MDAIRRLTRTSTILALILAFLIAIGFPAGYFLLGYENQRAVVETEAYVNSAFLSRVIASSPEYWKFQNHRLAEVLEYHTSKRYREQRTVVGLDGAVIASAAEDVAPPLLTVSHLLYDSGNVVGRIEISSSLRPLLKRTAFVGAAGLVLGLAVFLTLTTFPFRAVSTALRSVYEEKEKLRTLTTIAQDAIIMMDDEGRITFWNPAAEKTFGYPEAEALGRELHLLLIPERFHGPFRKGLEEFRKTGKGTAVGKTLELVTQRKGGDELDVELSLSAFQIAGQWHAVGIVRDIRGRKRAEEQSRQRGELVLALNGALVTLAGNQSIYEGDIEDAFRAITEASARAIGVGRVSIWFYTDGNDGIRCMDLWEAGPGRHSAGIVLRAVDYPAYFRELQQEYCIAAADAVTDPRTSEFAESYLKPLGIGAMLDVPIRVSGKVIGVACHEHLGAPRAWTVEEQSFVTAIAGFTALAIEIGERNKAEKRVLFANEELELKVWDRTRQLVEAQEELIRKEKLSILGQLAGSVGHELRNPLGVMSNAVYFLKLVHADGDDTTREYLDLIKHEIDTSERIISDLLDYARTREPQPKSLSARRLVDECVGKCVFPKNVDLETALPESLPLIRGDALQMGQVLQNLTTNAIQAMPEGGRLRIEARSATREELALRGSGVCRAGETALPEGDEFVEFTLSDTGVGVAPENLKRLFQPLFTTKAKGIGLGLVVCKRLVEANGGGIWVKSAPGEGTTFTVIMPTESVRA